VFALNQSWTFFLAGSLRVGHRAEGIIDKKDVNTSAHERLANTRSEIAAAFIRAPTPASLVSNT
jgi:hypothetical protein